MGARRLLALLLVAAGLAALLLSGVLLAYGFAAEDPDGWRRLGAVASALFLAAFSGLGTGGGLAVAGRRGRLPRPLVAAAAAGALASLAVVVHLAWVLLEGGGSSMPLAVALAAAAVVDAVGLVVGVPRVLHAR